MPEVIEIPRMLFRGRKVYLESRDVFDSESVEHFTDFIEHYTGHVLQDNSFYHKKAKEALSLAPL